MAVHAAGDSACKLIQRRAVLRSLHELARKVGIAVFITDGDAEAKAAEGEPGHLVAGGDAVIVIVRGEDVHRGNPVTQWNVFSPGNAMNLVVASGVLAVRLQEE